MCALTRPYIYIYIRVLQSCKTNFLFDKFVGGKKSIVAAGTRWAYFILLYPENQEGNSVPWFFFYMFTVASSTVMVIVVTQICGCFANHGFIGVVIFLSTIEITCNCLFCAMI